MFAYTHYATNVNMSFGLCHTDIIYREITRLYYIYSQQKIDYDVQDCRCLRCSYLPGFVRQCQWSFTTQGLGYGYTSSNNSRYQNLCLQLQCFLKVRIDFLGINNDYVSKKIILYKGSVITIRIWQENQESLNCTLFFHYSINGRTFYISIILFTKNRDNG